MTKRYTCILFLLSCFVMKALANVRYWDANQLSSNLITSVCQDRDGYIWIATEYGLNRFDGIRFTHYFHDDEDSHSISMDHVSHLLTDREGRVWLTTYRALQYYDAASDQFLSARLPKGVDNMDRMALDAKGHLQVECAKGILSVDTKNLQVTLTDETSSHLFHEPDIPEVTWPKDQVPFGPKQIRAYLMDRNGNQWVGCFLRGLVLIPALPDPFHYLDLQKAVGSDQILRGVFADRQGALYVSQEENGLVEIDTEGRQVRQMIPGKTARSMYDEGDGNFLIGTHCNGLCRINTTTQKEQWTLTKGKRITSIVKDKQGVIYVCAFADGVYRIDPVTLEAKSLNNSHLKLFNSQLNALYFDRQGHLWMGSYYGVDIYDPINDRMVEIPMDTLLRKAIVHSIIETADGTIWCGSSKGLYAYHPKKQSWQRISTREGLSNNFVCGLVEDAKRNQLWISTFHGLNCLDIKSGNIVNFYRGNGLHQDGYSRGACGRSSKGQLFFGNEKGVTWFIPEEMTSREFKHELVLTGLIVNGKQQMPVCNLKMSYQSSCILQFSPLDYREMDNVFLEYRFENAGKWNRLPAGQSELSLIQLKSGSHKLQVRACENGVYSTVKTIYIRVSPPWYRSWWAYLIYLLILSAIIVEFILFWRRREQAESNEAKIRFFVDASHELRSPLTLIKSPLEMLMKDEHDEKTQRALQNIQRNTNRLLQLTDEILSLRKIEKGQMVLHYADTDLTQFVGDICHLYDYQSEQRGIKMSFLAPEQPIHAWIDRTAFEKIVANLIGNAFKYVQKGGEIAVQLTRNNEQLTFSVTDTGPGIDEEQLKHVFERFYQTSARPTEGQIGYGIGLNLTSQMVKLHGGHIEAHNRADRQGSAFTLFIPLGNSHLPKEQLVDEHYFDQKPSESPLPTSSQTDKTKLQRHKTSNLIAIVDDSEEIRNYLSTELAYSYKVVTYTDGKSALQGITDNIPDLVISDVMMPVMDGIELLKRLKQNTKTSHIPIVLLTSRTAHDSRIEGLKQGADAYVDKPFNMEELEARINSLITNRKRVQGKFSGAQEQEGVVKKIELKGNDEELMERIMKVVNERLSDEEFNVEVLASAVGLSRVQLHRRMKEMTGIPVGDFIRNLRLQQAARLLEKGDVTVSQVTWAIGMSNPTHFATAFKKLFGMTPTEYMNRHQEETKA